MPPGSAITLRWVALALGAIPAPATAQTDYRNLDHDRPTRVEDAYTIERYAFDVLMAYGVEREKGGGTIHSVSPEIAYGLLPNFHLGFQAPVALVDMAGGAELGLAGMTAFAHYNLSAEGGAPAMGLRVDGVFPVGRFSGSDVWITAKAMLTRSFGRTRAHLNGAVRFGPRGTPGLVESPGIWWAGLALDRTFYRRSLLIVVEGRVEQAARGAPLAPTGTVGLRWQWTPTTVLDLGVARGFRADLGPEIAVAVGVSYVFGLRGLMPSGRAGRAP